MTPAKLRKLTREIARLRAGTPKPRELQRLARKLGRKESNRGKEPTWINTKLPGLSPVSIPVHSQGIPRPTLQSVVDDLEADLFKWEQVLEAKEKRGGNGNGKGRKGLSQGAVRPGTDPD